MSVLKAALLSVIIPVYNVEPYLEECLNSVINQTYTNWELIIVDDCSTDNTDKVVKPYLKDKRIQYLKVKTKPCKHL